MHYNTGVYPITKVIFPESPADMASYQEAASMVDGVDIYTFPMTTEGFDDAVAEHVRDVAEVTDHANDSRTPSETLMGEKYPSLCNTGGYGRSCWVRPSGGDGSIASYDCELCSWCIV